jgi:hypothetical protein
LEKAVNTHRTQKGNEMTNAIQQGMHHPGTHNQRMSVHPRTAQFQSSMEQALSPAEALSLSVTSSDSTTPAAPTTNTEVTSTNTTHAVPAPAPAPAVTVPAVSQFERSVTGVSAYGTESSYNSTEFATAQTAAEIAQKIGGKVEELQFDGAFSRSAPERVIVGPHGQQLNAGLVADLFNKYGDAPGSEAWTVINRDLGITNT